MGDIQLSSLPYVYECVQTVKNNNMSYTIYAKLKTGTSPSNRIAKLVAIDLRKQPSGAYRFTWENLTVKTKDSEPLVTVQFLTKKWLILCHELQSTVEDYSVNDR